MIVQAVHYTALGPPFTSKVLQDVYISHDIVRTDSEQSVEEEVLFFFLIYTEVQSK